MTQIAPGDVQFLLSNPSASVGHSGTGTPGNSLGKYASTTQISTNPMDDLFLDLTGAQNVALQVDYQCLFVWNNTDTGNLMRAPVIFLPTAGIVAGADLAVAVDPIGPVLAESSSPQAAVIDSSTQAPSIGEDVTWYTPQATYYDVTYRTWPEETPMGDTPDWTSLHLSDIPPGYVQAIWFKRTATNCAAVTGNAFTLQCIFNTST